MSLPVINCACRGLRRIDERGRGVGGYAVLGERDRDVRLYMSARGNELKIVSTRPAS